MSVDTLQEKIRKIKNPSVLCLDMSMSDIPEYIRTEEGNDALAYVRFSKELLSALKGSVPAVRVGFSSFVFLGGEGISCLSEVLRIASALGYYVILDAPEILSPTAAGRTAEMLFGKNSLFPCDGVIISGYLGSDIIKPFFAILQK